MSICSHVTSGDAAQLCMNPAVTGSNIAEIPSISTDSWSQDVRRKWLLIDECAHPSWWSPSKWQQQHVCMQTGANVCWRSLSAISPDKIDENIRVLCLLPWLSTRWPFPGCLLNSLEISVNWRFSCHKYPTMHHTWWSPIMGVSVERIQKIQSCIGKWSQKRWQSDPMKMLPENSIWSGERMNVGSLNMLLLTEHLPAIRFLISQTCDLISIKLPSRSSTTHCYCSTPVQPRFKELIHNFVTVFSDL